MVARERNSFIYKRVSILAGRYLNFCTLDQLVAGFCLSKIDYRDNIKIMNRKQF